MPPPDTREGRPSPAGPAETVTATGTLSRASVTHGTVTKAELAAWLRLDRPDYETGWRHGYRWGFDAGRDVGARDVHAAEEARWRAFAEQYNRLAGRLPWDDLERLRNTPTGAAYAAALLRRGGREYLGGPVDWYTGAPVVEGGAT